MAANFKDALKLRRTYYALSNKSLIGDQEIEDIISHVLLHTPSPFNSQSTRIVLLLGENHKKLWQITKDALKKIVPAESFAATESKIEGAFASGYGSVLFLKINQLLKDYKMHFLPMRIISLYGLSIHPECTNWVSGRFLRKPASEHPCSITIH